MRGSAIAFADRMRELEERRFDLVLANDMTSVADLRALAPRAFADVPVVTYFHENQLTYPLPDESARDYQYAFTNVTTCLASDEAWFNSEYHRREFLAAVDALLRKMPDRVPEGVAGRILARSRVVHPGIEMPPPAESGRARPYTVLWNQRWEWDKDPDAFFDAVLECRRRGIDLRVAVVGEQFRDRPAVFDRVRGALAGVAVAWGYVESRAEYEAVLARADIVVSAARHEFFGLAAVEAAAAGCVPLLPKRLSYPEVFDAGANAWVFYDEGTLADRLTALLEADELPSRAQCRALVGGCAWRERIAEWDERLAAAAHAREG